MPFYLEGEAVEVDRETAKSVADRNKPLRSVATRICDPEFVTYFNSDNKGVAATQHGYETDPYREWTKYFVSSDFYQPKEILL